MSKLAWKIVDCTTTTTRHTLLAAVLDPGLGGGGGGGESSAADVGPPSIEILKERKNENDKIFLNNSHPRGVDSAYKRGGGARRKFNHSYDYRPNWTPLSPVTITYYYY